MVPILLRKPLWLKLRVANWTSATERRFISTPSGRPGPFSVSCFDPRSAAHPGHVGEERPLVPDNKAVSSSNTDTERFRLALHKDPALLEDKDKFYNALMSNVIDPQDVPFSDVRSRHVEALDMGRLGEVGLEQGCVDVANKPNSVATIAIHRSSMCRMKRHFEVSLDAGCRDAIGQLILAAALYAQDTIDGDARLRESLENRYRILKPRIGVFNRLQVPPTNFTRGRRSYSFHGALDYGIGLIPSPVESGLSSGTAPACKLSNAFCSITEATSPEYMSGVGHHRVLAELLTTLIASRRTHFSSILTNGVSWRFYTAYDGGERLRPYHIRDFTIYQDSGAIVELLKDMMLYEDLSESLLIKGDYKSA
ncbi:hypothetical protein LshimejAT787_1101280 [Lyophyllum shimeji]|uniref:Uncharacterized protein n=1 Tax=Lyophyllum shimeji TaxID=47721 RepID=A0A9P3UQY8_LYOSH|nr:hypothetical protein LshimejAT787_1101280 [Lyophyllum shimeji]